MSKPYPTDILNKLKVTIVSWKEIDATLEFGDLSLEKMQAVLERGEALRNQIGALEAQLTDLRNKRDDAFTTGWKYITRLRNGIKSIYGDDSSEYEMVGRKRRSKHKSRSTRALGKSL